MAHPWYRLVSDDEWIDDIHLRVVPRFKTSELSGDEWRISAVVEFSRKGHIVKTEPYHDLRTALAYISKYSASNMYPGNLGIIGDVVDTLVQDYCMQPGCSEPWTVEYNMTTQGCSHCGDVKQVEFTEHHRRFCEQHKNRGDSSLDDSERNYVDINAGGDSAGSGGPTETTPKDS